MQDGECGEDVFAVSYLTCHRPLHCASHDAYPVVPVTPKLSALSASHRLIRIVSPQNIKHGDMPTLRIGTEARNNADGEQERRERPPSKPYWLCSFQTILADCRRIMASLRRGAEWPAPRARHQPCIPVPSHWPDIRGSRPRRTLHTIGSRNYGRSEHVSGRPRRSIFSSGASI
jgi:hypothetical protein